MGKKHYHVNRRKTWVCPYFRWDGDRYLSCDAGKPVLPDRKSANEYMTRYCADKWQECSLAQAWIKYAEEIYDQKRGGAEEA